MTLESHIPAKWKHSNVIPVPKKSSYKVLNDLRPVALTSVAMKCLERLILSKLRPLIGGHEDDLQFAYRKGRSVEDAIIFFLETVYGHLDKSNTYVRALFIDFSSAFNTIQPHLLIRKLRELNINVNITKWLLDFLTHRTQNVSVNLLKSTSIVTNTGAPQGCVCSPVLFTLYTSSCVSSHDNVKILKYADDTCILGLIDNGIETNFRNDVDKFSSWCSSNFLQLNVSKTKEIVFDFRKSAQNLPVNEVKINNEPVELVNTYKYLGVTIDKKLNFSDHVNATTSKLNKRMYFLRKLRSIDLKPELIELFYKATMQSIMTFCLIGWGGNISKSNMLKINRIVKRASKTCNSEQDKIEELISKLTLTKVKKLMNSTNIFASKFVKNERSSRIVSLKSRTSRYLNSFIPRGIREYNKLVKR